MEHHRARYGMLGKEEWWWLMDDTLLDVAASLNAHSMVSCVLSITAFALN